MMTLRNIFKRPTALILSQPNYPVPAIRDGSSAILIEDTLECLGGKELVCLSVWDEAHAKIDFDKNIYLLARKTSVKLRLFRKLLMQSKFYCEILSGLDSNQQGLLVALKWVELIYRPRIIVVHATKPEWVVRVKKWCGNKTKVLGYYHHSEIHLSEQSILDDLLKLLDGHIFVSDFASKSFVERVESIPGKSKFSVFTVKNGNNTTLFSPVENRSLLRSQLGIGENKIVFLFVGRLIPRKGLHCLLHALTALSNDLLQKIELIVVGSYDFYVSKETDYISQLREMASDNRLRNKVFFIGYVPHKLMHLYYQASDVLVFPSIDFEGMPLSVIEAQMSSLPVIASAVGGVPEVVLPDITGFLVSPPGDPTILAGYIEKLVEFPEIRAEMARSARQFAVDSFSREKMAVDFLNVVHKVCNKTCTNYG